MLLYTSVKGRRSYMPFAIIKSVHLDAGNTIKYV